MSKKIYEVVLPGFNGGTDQTDDLIKWVKADNIEQVKAHYKEVQSIEELEPLFSVFTKDIDLEL